MKKLLAFAVAILMAAPAFAAVQNVKVSGDIDSTYISRQNFNLGSKTPASSGIATGGLIDQSVFITQTRLRVDADLSDNVSTTVGLINERAWDTETSTNTNVQLYLAYVTLREFLYSPLSVTVGRQEFAYGNGLILGSGGVNNAATGNLATVAADLTKRTSYDGIKAVLDYKPLTLDLIYFKNSSGGTNTGGLVSGGSHLGDDSSVYGINANYQLGDAMNSVVEGYLFSRNNGKKTIVASGTKEDNLYVPGLRVSTNPIKGLNTQAEVAWQLGRKINTATATAGGDNERRNAMAYQVLASYAIPVAELEKYKTTANVSYTHVTGDKNGNTARPLSGFPNSEEVYTAWDPFNEAQGGGTIYNTLFNLTNLNILAVGVTANPIQDVTASFTWSGLWADKRYLSGENTLTLIQPDGTTVAPVPTYGTQKDLGNEYDVNLNYAYTEDVTLGLSLGWFVPGKVFNGNNDTTASQALVHVNVNF